MKLSELTYEQLKPRWTRRKPGVTAKARAKRRRFATKDHGEIRAYVFARERDICRCCRKRRAESMHEIVFRSQGGKVSKRNSIAVCGDGVRGCHGLLQRHEIDVYRGLQGAEGTMSFYPETRAADDWLGIKAGEVIESPVMFDMETAE